MDIYGQCCQSKFPKVCNPLLNYLKYKPTANVETWDIFHANWTFIWKNINSKPEAVTLI